MSSLGERFHSYKASKGTLFWSCAGTAIATMIIGFTWGGWVTSGSATERAETMAENAVAELAADICFNRFMAAPDARASLVALKEESTYGRDNFVNEGGWTTLGGREDPIEGAGELCAERLAEAELPAELADNAAGAQLDLAVDTTQTVAN